MAHSELESKVIRFLAERFEAGNFSLTHADLRKELSVSTEQAEVLIRTMEQLGAVERHETRHGGGGMATVFMICRISFRAVELCREMDAANAKRPDFVEQIHRRIKQNPVAALVIIAFLLLAFFAPIYNMIVDFGERIGWLKAP